MPSTRFGGQPGSARRESKSPTLPAGPTLLEEDLLGMKKKDLLSLAASLGLALKPKATNAKIVEAILEVG